MIPVLEYFPYCETQPSSIQRLSSIIFPCFVVRSSMPHGNISTYFHCMMFKTMPTIHFLKALGPRISKLILPSVSCTNTQIHKYSLRQSARRTQHVVYFWKEDCSRIWKNDIPVCQTHIYKNTNIQIHKYTNIEKGIIQGNIKWHSHVSNAKIQKYTNTKYTNAAYDKLPEDPTCSIFLKRNCSRIWKIIFPRVKRTSTKDTNTQIQILLFQDIYMAYMAYAVVG